MGEFEFCYFVGGLALGYLCGALMQKTESDNQVIVYELDEEDDYQCKCYQNDEMNSSRLCD